MVVAGLSALIIGVSDLEGKALKVVEGHTKYMELHPSPQFAVVMRNKEFHLLLLCPFPQPFRNKQLAHIFFQHLRAPKDKRHLEI